MDHRLHHDRLVARARERVITGYAERHHVIPRCLGGTNDRSNIVRLTPEEHFLIHLLLVKMHPGHAGLVSAVFLLSRSSEGKTCRNNKIFGWLRREYAARKAGWKHSPDVRAIINQKNRGKVRTQDFKDGVAAFHTGRKRPAQTGLKISESHKKRCRMPEFREKMARIRTGAVVTEESKARMSAAQKGRVHSEETRAKMSAAHLGRKKSEETRQRMSEARKRRALTAQA